jgi:hypothetical protein
MSGANEGRAPLGAPLFSTDKLTSVVIGNSQIAPNMGSHPDGEAFFIRIRGPQALGDNFGIQV